MLTSVVLSCSCSYSKRVCRSKRPAHEELVRVLTEYLQAQGALVKCNPQQLALVAFDAGYFYRVFLEKNKVTTEVSNESEHRD
jgi:tRNA G26 N,N-dimethylase Trm1